MITAGIIISAYVKKKNMGRTWWHNSFLTPTRQKAFLLKLYSEEFTDRLLAFFFFLDSELAYRNIIMTYSFPNIAWIYF